MEDTHVVWAESKRQVPWITLILIGINVLIFLYVEMTGSSDNVDYMIQMGVISNSLIFDQHEYYRIISHFFLHYGLEHILNNMFSLLIIGYAIEEILGKRRFLAIYFMSGILAGLASIVYNMMIGVEVYSCGASGAIFGMMGALLALLVFQKERRSKTEIPRYLLFMGISIASGLQDASIDNSAHIGGFVAGFAICASMIVFLRLRERRGGR